MGKKKKKKKPTTPPRNMVQVSNGYYTSSVSFWSFWLLKVLLKLNSSSFYSYSLDWRLNPCTLLQCYWDSECLRIRTGGKNSGELDSVDRLWDLMLLAYLWTLKVLLYLCFFFVKNSYACPCVMRAAIWE